MLNRTEEVINSNGPGDILYKKWDVRFRDDFFSQIYWSYFPITEKYFFEGNPSFLYEYKDLFDLGRYPVITLRDGFVGLLDFFLVHPTPSKDFKSKLIINKKFETLVPKQWFDYVSTYSIEPRQILTNKNDLLIVHGLAVEELFWKKTPLDLIKSLKKKTQEFKEIIFLLPQRESMLSTEDNQQIQYMMELVKAIYEVFGFDAKVEVNIKDYLEQFNEKIFSFYNLDIDNVFIADNYIDHYLYSLGGVNISDREIKRNNDSLEYNLSFHHKIVIENINPNNNIFPKFYLPHKLSGKKDISLYDVYRSLTLKKIFKESF